MASQIAGNSTVVHSLVRLTTKKTNTKVPHYYTWWTPWMCFRQVLISQTVCPNWQIWCRYSDVIMSAMVSQLTSVRIVCSTACLGNENIKAPRYWPLWGESTWRWPVVTLTKGSNTENISIWWHHHDNWWWVFDDVSSLLVKSHHIISRCKLHHKMWYVGWDVTETHLGSETRPDSLCQFQFRCQFQYGIEEVIADLTSQNIGCETMIISASISYFLAH